MVSQKATIIFTTIQKNAKHQKMYCRNNNVKKRLPSTWLSVSKFYTKVV